MHAPDVDRSRANTWPPVNAAIDREAQVRIEQLAAAGAPEHISERLEQLNHEWDLDRVLEAEASLMGLLTLGLAVTLDRRLVALPAVIAAVVLVHGVHGWYPLLPVFRRMKIRTGSEIDRERYALKALRGDFLGIPAAGSAASKERAAAAWAAACA
jgi:hypothetical protein